MFVWVLSSTKYIVLGENFGFQGFNVFHLYHWRLPIGWICLCSCNNIIPLMKYYFLGLFGNIGGGMANDIKKGFFLQNLV